MHNAIGIVKQWPLVGGPFIALHLVEKSMRAFRFGIIQFFIWNVHTHARTHSHTYTTHSSVLLQFMSSLNKTQNFQFLQKSDLPEPNITWNCTDFAFETFANVKCELIVRQMSNLQIVFVTFPLDDWALEQRNSSCVHAKSCTNFINDVCHGADVIPDKCHPDKTSFATVNGVRVDTCVLVWL